MTLIAAARNVPLQDADVAIFLWLVTNLVIHATNRIREVWDDHTGKDIN